MHNLFDTIANQINNTITQQTDKAVNELLEKYALPNGLNALRNHGYMLHITKNDIKVDGDVVRYNAIIELCRVVDTKNVALEINFITK